ncbi:hypothetical protein FKX85_14515 [Echinicola soli]|uniref:Uncharacterized protein n=1 Tax=Echinicola soli TaxID=2591634 RepID=A0A514CK96_9BACT|nr:hypothetical protein [Echinicola soli]QDH80187.1 hypothetical protein FKX85_14515 [Echinicola soli]
MGVGANQSQYVTVCDDYFHTNDDGAHTILEPSNQMGYTGSSGGPGSKWGSDPAMPDPTCPKYYGSQCYHQPGSTYEALVKGYTETLTPDDGYTFYGETDYIPSSITLKNGNTVKVTFGVTNSDDKSANQKVAQLLIKGIEFALNEANNNLPASGKLTE